MIKRVSIRTNDKMETSNAEETNDGEDGEEPKVKFFTEIKQNTRDLIDEIKQREGKTIGAIIDTSVQSYFNYKSMSPEIQALIEKYRERFGSAQKVIEEAIWLLEDRENPQNAADINIWCRARDEMQMILIGKTTFNELLIAAETPEESLDRPIKKNIALDVILWYTGRPIKSLTLDDIIYAIKKVWIVANYFYYIDVKKEDADKYHIIFKHHQDKRYSNYWLRYFEEVFRYEDLSFKCAVEGEAFDETLSLTIKKLHDKKHVELDAI